MRYVNDAIAIINLMYICLDHSYHIRYNKNQMNNKLWLS